MVGRWQQLEVENGRRARDGALEVPIYDDDRIFNNQTLISGNVFASRFHHLAENDYLVNWLRARVFVWEMAV